MKIVKALILFALVTSIFTIKVNAFTLDPISGLFENSTQIKINILANPPASDDNALQLRLKINNAEVINFEPVSDSNYISVIKDCSEGTYFTANSVCASY